MNGKLFPCCCGTGKSYAACCEPLHSGGHAATAEALMRSRYSAYVLRLESYLLATWHASTRPQSFGFDDPEVKWLGLQVKNHTATGDRAVVEFVARYRTAGRGQRLHEISRFVREDGQWYYVDGEHPG